jgi:hypothetical protein
VSKKFHLLDVAASSHAHAMGTAVTHTARVSAFNNLGDDSSPDVREAPSLGRTMEKHVSQRLRCLVSFCALASQFLPWALITSFADPTHIAPSLNLPLESLVEHLEYCLPRVSFILLPHFYVVMLVLISFLFHRRLHCQKSSVRRGLLNWLRCQRLWSCKRWPCHKLT